MMKKWIVFLTFLTGFFFMNRMLEIDILAKTIWGEARGEGRKGMEAVASVIRNRVQDKRWPSTYRAVCKQPFQFSMWNDGDPNKQAALAVTADDPSFQAAMEIATMTYDGVLGDVVAGANHYFNSHIVNPAWAAAMKFAGDVGNHKFFIG